MTYKAPKSGLKAFTCPHCSAFARQFTYGRDKTLKERYVLEQSEVRTTVCEHCEKFCIYYFDKLVYPNLGNAPPPNLDMPEDVKKIYEEAASISTNSPRGAAALLRLALQKLCVHLGGTGKNINDDIALLVKNGLPVAVQQSLDSVRVIGNNAVHPGQINADNAEVVGNLFMLLNLITDYMIYLPKKVASTYAGLPEGSKKAIEDRDSK